MQGMMDGMMGGGMIWGAVLFVLLTLVVLMLAAGALVKYLFFSGKGGSGERQPKHRGSAEAEL